MVSSGAWTGSPWSLEFFPVAELPAVELVERFQAEGFEPGRQHAAFVWRDSWLLR